MSHHKNHKKSHELHTSAAGAKPGAVVADGIRSEPASDHTRIRAYEISQARNGGPGDELADWIQAEKETKSAQGAPR